MKVGLEAGTQVLGSCVDPEEGLGLDQGSSID